MATIRAPLCWGKLTEAGASAPAAGNQAGSSLQSTHRPERDDSSAASMNFMARAPSSTVGKSRAAACPWRRATIAPPPRHRERRRLPESPRDGRCRCGWRAAPPARPGPWRSKTMAGWPRREVVQLVGLLLEPFEAAGGAEDAEVQAVNRAGARLCHPHHAGRAALQLEQDAGVVVGVAAGHDRADVGADSGRIAARSRSRPCGGRGCRCRRGSARRRPAPAALARLEPPPPLARRQAGIVALHVFDLHHRISPTSPSATMARACRTMGRPCS